MDFFSHQEPEFAQYETHYKEWLEFLDEAEEQFWFDEVEEEETETKKEKMERMQTAKTRLDAVLTEEAKDWFMWRMAKGEFDKTVPQYFLRRVKKLNTNGKEEARELKTRWETVITRAVSELEEEL